MPWLLASPGHLQPWYWLCRIYWSLSSVRNDFIYPSHHSIDKRWKKANTFHDAWNKSSTTSVKIYDIVVYQRDGCFRSFRNAFSFQSYIVVLIYFKEHKRRVTIPVIPPEHWDGADSWNAHERQGPFNSLRPRHNGRHFADDVFKSNFLNENVLISIKISLKFVPKGPINNIPALVEIMAWRRPGDKPLSEPRMESLLTHVCVTRLQWVNLHKHNHGDGRPGDVRHQGISIYGIDMT